MVQQQLQMAVVVVVAVAVEVCWRGVVAWQQQQQRCRHGRHTPGRHLHHRQHRKSLSSSSRLLVVRVVV